MKSNNKNTKTLLVLFLSLIFACGAETVIALVFIPAFGAVWSVENDSDYKIGIFRDGSLEESSGKLSGQEEHLSNPLKDGNDIIGTFDGLNIEFTIERDISGGGNVTYSGKMIPFQETDSIVKIELNSVQEGDLVLIPNVIDD